MNQITIIGNCGSDPEVKQINDTLKVSKASVATSERYKDKEGNKKEETEWFNVVAYNQLATLFESYVHKGDKIRVTGKVKTRTYEKDGVTHYVTEVIANELEFLSSKQDKQYAKEETNDFPF